jgi:hypothetical protein
MSEVDGTVSTGVVPGRLIFLTTSASGTSTERMRIDSAGVVTIGGNPMNGTWTNYTPTWTNITVGNGAVTARYMQIGKIVFINLGITFGSTTSVSGIIIGSLPITGSNLQAAANYNASIYDASPFNIYSANAYFPSNTTVGLKAQNSAGTYVVGAYTNATTPITWTQSDAFLFNLFYEAA